MKDSWINTFCPLSATCCISVSKTITQKEWEKVYEETLKLAKPLDLCTVEDFEYHGVTGKWFVQAKEKKDYFGGPFYYWKPEGLYSERMGVAPLQLNRELNEDDREQAAGSAFLGYAYDDESLASTDFGLDLENKNYITSILALAFLMEARLPDKIFVYGEFDYHLASEAVTKINKHLKKRIGLPTVCKPDALMSLIKETRFSEKEKFELFLDTYMGQKDEKYFKSLKENFSDEMTRSYTEQYKSENNDTEDKKYDIEETIELFKYKKGNSIDPELLDKILSSFDILEAGKKQRGFALLSTVSPNEQIRHLAIQKQNIPLCDTDWKHIIHYFEKHKNGLERYYSLFMANKEPYTPTNNLVRALMVNDELYNFCHKLYLENKK